MNNNSKSVRVALDTLGCKLNQAETELLAGQFVQAGCKLVSSADEADIYILNTCTVTHIADRKSRHLLRLAHRRNPGAVIVAAGCYAQRAAQELARIDGVSLVLGNEDKMNLVPLLEESGYLSVPACNKADLLAEHCNGLRSRTFVRVQDGCNNHCAYCSGSDDIGAAYEFIKRGDAIAMFAGGSESIMGPMGFTAFIALKALSTRNDEPQQASRPFDSERDGFVISEGATILVMENLDHARKRGANILAEIIGYGASADAFHVTQPAADGNGAARSMQFALNKAELLPTDVDYINAHGTSTPLNDKTETIAIKTVFGENAYKIPVSST